MSFFDKLKYTQGARSGGKKPKRTDSHTPFSFWCFPYVYVVLDYALLYRVFYSIQGYRVFYIPYLFSFTLSEFI